MHEVSESNAAVKPAFYWPGSKSRIAPWIVSLMRPAVSYVEPFAGSAAVLLARPRAEHETINDLDRGVVAFFRTLRDRPAELHHAVSLTPYSEAEYLLSTEPDPDESLDDLERARRFFVRTAQGFQGNQLYPAWAMSVDPLGGTSRANKWKMLQRRFDQVSTRLEGVQVASRDAIQLIKKFVDHDDVTIYCDPPYANEDVTVRYDHHEESLHDDLADVLHNVKGHVLISGYPGKYDSLYATWQRIERQVAATGGSAADGSRGGHSIVRTEVIWSNKQTWPGVNTDS